MDILAYYGLNEQPFRISPDPRFLYLSDQVKEAMAKVQVMTKDRIGPLYMYGPIGSGKTSIMRRLYEQLQDEKTYNVHYLFAPNVKTANAFLRIILNSFQVPLAKSYTQSLDNFEGFLIKEYQKGNVPILMIDEGQNMTRDTLKLIHYLLNFETNTEKLLQIVLAGQLELGQRILHYKELASRMFPIGMSSMSQHDLEDMLNFRWMVAGGKESPFSEDAYKAIYVYSKGLPRDAIKLADETLRHLFIKQQQHADASVIDELAPQLNLSK